MPTPDLVAIFANVDLGVLIEPRVDLARLATILDDLGHEGRLHTIRHWRKSHQAAIFEAAKGFRAITVADLVPAGTAPKVGIVHDLENTLPVFSHAQKVFCKGDEEAWVWGYNAQRFSAFTGPGYFAARPSHAAGELTLDYREVPPAGWGGKPADWPLPAPNGSKMIGAIVFGHLVDHLRGVSSHVAIGRAQRARGAEAKWMNEWFVLCRQEEA